MLDKPTTRIYLVFQYVFYHPHNHDHVTTVMKIDKSVLGPLRSMWNQITVRLQGVKQGNMRECVMRATCVLDNFKQCMSVTSCIKKEEWSESLSPWTQSKRKNNFEGPGTGTSTRRETPAVLVTYSWSRLCSALTLKKCQANFEMFVTVSIIMLKNQLCLCFVFYLALNDLLVKALKNFDVILTSNQLL